MTYLGHFSQLFFFVNTQAPAHVFLIRTEMLTYLPYSKLLLISSK